MVYGESSFILHGTAGSILYLRRLPPPEVWPGTSHQGQDVVIPLPPIHVQDRLVDLFFNYVHPMFPVLHQTRFLTEYNLRFVNAHSSSLSSC